MSVEVAPPSPTGRASAAMAVTLFTVFVHGATFVTQVLIAHFFGAGADVDAFLAASALPQYLTSVLVGTLPVVLIPALASQTAAGRTAGAARTARSMAILFGATAAVIALLGIMAARPIVAIVAPGIQSSALSIAVVISYVVWPAMVGAVLSTVLTAVNHAAGRFAWASAVPAIAAVLNVALLAGLARWAGIFAAAIGGTVAALLQAALLLPALTRDRVSGPRSPWRDEGVRALLMSLWPLLLSGVFIRANLVIERHLASGFEEGAIAHISYAARIAALLSVICSTGISTVLFPSFAALAASGDRQGLRSSMGKATRLMWLFVAPVIAIGLPLSSSVVAVALQHGRFTALDTAATSMLLRIYLWSVVATALGMITGRVLYALNAARLVATAGAIEALLYIGYTVFLSRSFGLRGVAWGFVIYATLSLTWHVLWIQRKVGWAGNDLPRRLLSTALCAALGGIAAHAVMRTGTTFVPMFARATVGLTSYVALLFVVNREDAMLLLRAAGAVRSRTRPGESHSIRERH